MLVVRARGSFFIKLIIDNYLCCHPGQGEAAIRDLLRQDQSKFPSDRGVASRSDDGVSSISEQTTPRLFASQKSTPLADGEPALIAGRSKIPFAGEGVPA